MDTNNQIDNKYITWVLYAVIANTVFAVLGIFIPLLGLLSTIAGIATIVLIIMDAQMLKKNNIANAPSLWWFLIFPVYVYKRQKILNQGMNIFWTIIGVIVARFVIIQIIGMLIVIGLSE